MLIGGGHVPFTRVRGGKYRSPSGKLWTPKQVKAYYATKGFKRKVRSGGKRRRR
jgi:hypothetical protein